MTQIRVDFRKTPGNMARNFIQRTQLHREPPKRPNCALYANYKTPENAREGKAESDSAGQKGRWVAEHRGFPLALSGRMSYER